MYKRDKPVAGFDEDEDDSLTTKRARPTLPHKRTLTENATPPPPPPPPIDEKNKEDGADEEEDPLDAFMAGISAEIKKQDADKPKQAAEKPSREIFEQEDYLESYIDHRNKQQIEQAKQLGAQSDVLRALAARADAEDYNSDEEVYATAKAVDQAAEYDSDDNPVVDKYKKTLAGLEPVDHSQIAYPEFEKNFYEEHSDIKRMTDEQVEDYRKQLDIRVSGYEVPRPVKGFEHCCFDETLLSLIRKQGFEKPTPIQAQAIPAAMSGRDIIGIAKTGSGKTAAFIWPMLMHIMDQEELSRGEGPIGIICAPTRELAQQIYTEFKKYSKGYGLRVSPIYGGLSKQEQFKALHEGCDVVIGTPGRIIDMLKMKACKLNKVTYLVLDEADRMFDMGFEPQVRGIISQIRPDRQTLLFSATFERRVEALASEILTDPVRITVGTVGEANADVTQVFEILNEDSEKWAWLMRHLKDFVARGSVLIFVSQKLGCDELSNNLCKFGFTAGSIHGDKTQEERDEIISAFRDGIIPILVATDVAARGLDIPHIKTVVNYDSARDIDSHVHRIGRTGRAGDKEGVAYSLITAKETNFAVQLVRNLEGSNQEVPRHLMELAMKNPKFRRLRQGGYGGGRGGGGGRGRGRGGRWQKAKTIGGAGLGFGADDDNNDATSSSINNTSSGRAPLPQQNQLYNNQKQQQSFNTGGGGGGSSSGGSSGMIKTKFQGAFVSSGTTLGGFLKASSDDTGAGAGAGATTTTTKPKFQIFQAKNPQPQQQQQQQHQQQQSSLGGGGGGGYYQQQQRPPQQQQQQHQSYYNQVPPPQQQQRQQQQQSYNQVPPPQQYYNNANNQQGGRGYGGGYGRGGGYGSYQQQQRGGGGGGRGGGGGGYGQQQQPLQQQAADPYMDMQAQIIQAQYAAYQQRIQQQQQQQQQNGRRL